MIPDLPDLLDELERLLLGVVGTIQDEGEGAVKKRRVGGKGITGNFSLKVGFLDSLTGEAPKVYPEGAVQEPLVDVIDEKDGLRVIILLPGIRSRDVKVYVRNRLLHLEITRGDTTYSREIPCSLAPSDIKVSSVVEKNSVVEILFSKIRAAHSSE